MPIKSANKVAVIGAGVAGLATSIRLAVKGYDVTVFEANEKAGGKLSQMTAHGFRFDMGPSLFTLPQLVDELFEISNQKPRDFFNYITLDESCRYFYQDGTCIIGYTDRDRFAKEASEKTNVDKKKVVRFLKKSQFIYQSTAFLFLEKSLHLIKSYLSFKVLISFFKLPFLGLFTTMHKANKRQLSNPKLVQLFDRYATYNGSNPFRAPAILNIIPHLEFDKGAYFPQKGMYDIADSLYNLALSQGVTFHFQSKVQEISVVDKAVDGIIVNNDFVETDYVVCNTDIYFVYSNLLKGVSLPKKIKHEERSTSALIFYWGIKAVFPQLDLHNIFFAEDYEKEFQTLSDGRTIDNDPTIYINITSKKNPSDAPANCENWFVMVNTPSNNGQNWDDIIKQTKRHILTKLSRLLKTDIAPLIVSENILDPRGIESKTASFKGSLYGASSNKKMAAFFRHANFSKDISGLYFCGGSVHPGGGIPLALSSAKIVDGFFKYN